MFVVCVDKTNPVDDRLPDVQSITVGKRYKVLYDNSTGPRHYLLMCDNGSLERKPFKCFITLEEYRNNKISKIIEQC
jgi:hypothetical protein